MNDNLTVAHELETSARDLAARINAGLLNELDEGQRCDLRGLSLAMLGWSERLVTAEQERAGAERVARIGRLFGSVTAINGRSVL